MHGECRDQVVEEEEGHQKDRDQVDQSHVVLDVIRPDVDQHLVASIPALPLQGSR